MFEGRFSELLIIFVLALIVLGPEKLPRVVSEVGRWVGRARAMARQFREQLEEEVNLEEIRKAQAKPTPPPPPETSPSPEQSSSTDAPPTPSASGSSSVPVNSTPDTYSHAHPTDANGANPLLPTGGAESPLTTLHEDTAPAEVTAGAAAAAEHSQGSHERGT